MFSKTRVFSLTSGIDFVIERSLYHINSIMNYISFKIQPFLPRNIKKHRSLDKYENSNKSVSYWRTDSWADWTSLQPTALGASWKKFSVPWKCGNMPAFLKDLWLFIFYLPNRDHQKPWGHMWFIGVQNSLPPTPLLRLPIDTYCNVRNTVWAKVG